MRIRPVLRWRLLMGVGLLGLVALGFAVFVATRARDSWPPTVVIPPRPGRREGFTRDGRALVIHGPDGSTAWDLATGQPRPSPEIGLRRVAVAADGRSLIGVTGDDNLQSAVVRVNRESGATLAQFPLTGIRAVAPALSADGKSIRAVLVAPDRRSFVATWDLATGTETRREVFGPLGPPPHIAQRVGATTFLPFALDYAPDGRTWAYVQLFPTGIQLWDADLDRAMGALIPGPPGDSQAIFTADGRGLIFGGTTGAFTVVDLTGSRPARTIKADPGDRDLRLASMTISPDGRTLAVAWLRPGRSPTSLLANFWAQIQYYLVPGQKLRDSAVTLIDLPSGRTLAKAPGTTDPEFSPDGRWVVTREVTSWPMGVRPVPKPPSQDNGDAARPAP